MFTFSNLAFKKEFITATATRLCIIGSLLPVWLYLPLSSLLSLLLPHYLDYLSTDMPKTFSPQGLCTCWFLYQNYSSPDSHSFIDLLIISALCHLNIFIKLQHLQHWSATHVIIYTDIIYTDSTPLLWFRITFFFWNGLFISGAVHWVTHHTNCSTICDAKFGQRNHIVKAWFIILIIIYFWHGAH